MPVGGFGTILAPATSTLGREQEGVVVVNRRRPFPFLLLFLALFATLRLQWSHKRDISSVIFAKVNVVAAKW